MNAVAYRLRPLGPWASPWQADTLFGSLCWQLLRMRGEEPLHRMLDLFRQGNPPFVLSDPCPGEFLPRPVVLTTGSADAAREWRKHAWITREQFLEVRQGRPPAAPKEVFQPWREMRSLHASLSRETWSTTGDGSASLFESQEWTWADTVPEEQRFLTVYARVTSEWAGPLGQLLAATGQHGYGKKRTWGRGTFDADPQGQPCDWLEPLRFEDGFITLNRFVPHETDPVKGCWTVHTKYPKFGDARAAGDKPFKGRLVQLGPGSCFQLSGRPRRWYGAMLSGLPGHPDALHYGLALAIGMKWPG